MVTVQGRLLRKGRATLLALAVLLVLTSGAAGAGSAPTTLGGDPGVAAGNPSFQINRLAGANRYATAAAVSRRFFPTAGVPVVYVATGAAFPDGLAAGPAAARLGGPVLFVGRDYVTTPTQNELLRLKPARIVVVGGEGVISATVLDQLGRYAPGGARRVSGADRYATAAAVVKDAFPTAPVVYVANGESFPDALAGGAAAAARDGAVLLVRAGSIPTATHAELDRLRPAKIVVVGGTSVISASVASALTAYSPNVVRRAGADRYATSVSVSLDAFPAGAATAFVATGLAFPDALAGVAVAGLQNGPVLLVAGGLLPGPVAGELTRVDPNDVFLLGGEGVVGIGVAKAVQRLLGICWVGNRPAAGAAQLITRISGTTNQVALTFDMGGRLVPALDIVKFLVDNQVCATIFATGAMSQTTDGAAVMAALRAHPELFEVANHTMNHCNLVRGGEGSACPTTRPTDARVQKELTDAAAVLRAAFGQAPTPLWRPPYGEHDAQVRAAAAAVGYTKTMMWDIDPIDWDPGTSASEINARVVPNAVPGSIVLMHLGGYATLDALPSMVSQLRAKGYQLTSISDILD